MHRRHSQYPISEFVFELLVGTGGRTVDFVHQLGYQNTIKGLRRLDQWLVAGEGDASFFRRLCSRFPEHEVSLIEALEESKRLKQREQLELRRRSFEPRIWAETEREPYNTFSGIYAAKLKQISLPRERLKETEVAEVITEHYRKCDGECELFGKILRYRYEPEYGKKAYYDVFGSPEL